MVNLNHITLVSLETAILVFMKKQTTTGQDYFNDHFLCNNAIIPHQWIAPPLLYNNNINTEHSP